MWSKKTIMILKKRYLFPNETQISPFPSETKVSPSQRLSRRLGTANLLRLLHYSRITGVIRDTCFSYLLRCYRSTTSHAFRMVIVFPGQLGEPFQRRYQVGFARHDHTIEVCIVNFSAIVGVEKLFRTCQFLIWSNRISPRVRRSIFISIAQRSPLHRSLSQDDIVLR